MLSAEENREITSTSAGTKMGELLRRYWRPVAPVAELTDEHPTKYVRAFGEDLVLFRDKSGRVGLLGDHCAHRGASLCYGRLEERGISCPYHGWLYDIQGNILETPPERNDAIIKHVKQKAYPVRALAGLYWAYFGPVPAPELPLYDVLARKDGTRTIWVYPVLDCNWLAAAENTVDPAHLQILHQDCPGLVPDHPPVNTTRGYIDEIADYGFYANEYGIMKWRRYTNGEYEEHPAIFPLDLRVNKTMWIRTPIDDTHTMQYVVIFNPDASGVEHGDDEVKVEYIPPYKEPEGAPYPRAKYNMYTPYGQPLTQDSIMWETQGEITDRTTEHLSYSDRGVSLFRKLLRENMELVHQGKEPMGVIRDPNRGIIDTGLEASLMVNNITGANRPDDAISVWDTEMHVS